VDDEPDARNLIGKLLSAFGYQADVAADGVTALRLLEQKHYGLAILDYQMPGMNGLQLFKHIQRARPDMCGIFLTGNATLEVIYPALEAGVRRVLSKPVDFRELIPLIEEQLGDGAAK
jgi:CheY-like chemotaxis protein